VLDERELDEFFARHFHRTAFRLEVRDSYAVASDGGDLARYLAGEDAPDATRKNAWLDELRAPLLLVHGSDDTNVPVSESEQVAAALRRRGAPHQLLILEGEGHELLATASRVAFVHATVGWLVEYL